MKAFIANTKQLLQLDRAIPGQENFDQNKRQLCIPLYQREFTWTDEKISSFIVDVNSRDKFLGNIILDEQDQSYEIADGQQRITTCVLILIALHNYFEGSPYEQRSIKKYIYPTGPNPILKNESIGEWIHENGQRLELGISDDSDIFHQKAIFTRAYDTIVQQLETKVFRTGSISEFKNKLLNSTFLVLINNPHDNTQPIEQIFLDINEKAKLLEPEDIFKGHCFEKYSSEFYTELRDTWVDLKKQSILFKDFGVKDLSEYIYLYILLTQDRDIPQNLTSSGKHFLHDKTMDDINRLLHNMIEYGKAVSELSNNIVRSTYSFEDISPDSVRFRDTKDIIILKRMIHEILYPSQTYQKLPAFYFIYALKTKPTLREQITHDHFRRIITNLYLYNIIFAQFKSQKKTKKLIDHTIRDVIENDNCCPQDIINTAKELRRGVLEDCQIKHGERKVVLMFINSVIDFYNADENRMKNLYYDDSSCPYNLEHFLVPEYSRKKVNWITRDRPFPICIPEEIIEQFKKHHANFILLDRELNRSLGHDDVIEKMRRIRQWHTINGLELPKHIQIYFEHIENCDSFRQLQIQKEANAERAIVEPLYITFLREYFSDAKVAELMQEIEGEFFNSFSNNPER